MIPTAQQMISAHKRWMASGFSETTSEAAVRTLLAADRDLPNGLANSYPDEIAEWLANPRWSAQTKANYRQHLIRFGAWATDPDDPWMSYNPTLNLKRPKTRPGVPKPAHNDQLEQALAELSWPWRLHVGLAAYGGLRCIEVARQRREDITERIMYVHGKGDRRATVPTHAVVWAMVRDLPPGPVTFMADGRPATAHWVSHGTRMHLHRIGLQLSMHRFRHWFGTTIQRQYRDLRVTQEMLRHANPATTAVYTQVTDEAKWEALGTLPDLSGRSDEDGAGDDDS